MKKQTQQLLTFVKPHLGSRDQKIKGSRPWLRRKKLSQTKQQKLNYKPLHTEKFTNFWVIMPSIQEMLNYGPVCMCRLLSLRQLDVEYMRFHPRTTNQKDIEVSNTYFLEEIGVIFFYVLFIYLSIYLSIYLFIETELYFSPSCPETYSAAQASFKTCLSLMGVAIISLCHHNMLGPTL